MKNKKIFGYIFKVIAILLTLAIIGQIQAVIGSVVGIFKIVNGNLDKYQAGKVIGTLIYWMLHFTLTISLWVIGERWTKNKIKEDG